MRYVNQLQFKKSKDTNNLLCQTKINLKSYISKCYSLAKNKVKMCLCNFKDLIMALNKCLKNQKHLKIINYQSNQNKKAKEITLVWVKTIIRTKYNRIIHNNK